MARAVAIITPFVLGAFYFFYYKKMRVVNDNALQLSIYKAGAYEETVSFEEGDTIREVFERAWQDYEEWTLGGVAYTPTSTLEASDNNWRIEVVTKQIKQG